VRGIDSGAVLAVHTRWRRGPVVAGIAVAACTAGCFTDKGPGELTGTAATTEPASTSTATTLPPTSSESSSSTGDESTGAPDTGVAFRLSTLNIIDPHFFLTDANDPTMCSADVTAGLNVVVNNDIAEGGFNLVIYFEEMVPGAEMRLFQGDCEDPGDGTWWTCVKKEGIQQTVFDTMEVMTSPCGEYDPGVFQPANQPTISDPPPPCVRTMPQDFSVAVSNSAGALFLREAQIAASPDSTTDPKSIPTGILYGFLPKVSAEDITVEVPLTGTVTIWSVIDVMCAADYPDQLPSIDVLSIDGTDATGAWIAINFTAERVFYAP